jgi:N-methylhydantoinase A
MEIALDHRGVDRGCPIGIPVWTSIQSVQGWVDCPDRFWGAFAVRPQSAGANPGPACYARSELENASPTVTDANLILGRLDPDYFLDGQMYLETSALTTS